MKTMLLLGLASLAVLVTGCPHNDYTVELTPHGNTLERKLIFYRADGTNSNAAPNYQAFLSNELTAIAACYSKGKVTNEGDLHFATGEFSSTMPGELGGAGTYRHFATSLGSAGIYA